MTVAEEGILGSLYVRSPSGDCCFECRQFVPIVVCRIGQGNLRMQPELGLAPRPRSVNVNRLPRITFVGEKMKLHAIKAEDDRRHDVSNLAELRPLAVVLDRKSVV